MPTNACQFYYDCRHCGAVLRPLTGDCCVFCSYADMPCPPIQEARAAGSSHGCCAPDLSVIPDPTVTDLPQFHGRSASRH